MGFNSAFKGLNKDFLSILLVLFIIYMCVSNIYKGIIMVKLIVIILIIKMYCGRICL
jgi:hypothetical protein